MQLGVRALVESYVGFATVTGRCARLYGASSTDTSKCPTGLTKSTCEPEAVEGSFTGMWQCVECTDDFNCYDGQTCDLSTNTCSMVSGGKRRSVWQREHS